MKVKVLRSFINKYSKKKHEEGDILDVSEKRFKEINSTEHGVLVEEVKEPEK